MKFKGKTQGTPRFFMISKPKQVQWNRRVYRPIPILDQFLRPYKSKTQRSKPPNESISRSNHTELWARTRIGRIENPRREKTKWNSNREAQFKSSNRKQIKRHIREKGKTKLSSPWLNQAKFQRKLLQRRRKQENMESFVFLRCASSLFLFPQLYAEALVLINMCVSVLICFIY